MLSHPSRLRAVMALAIIAPAFLDTVAVKLTRGGAILFAPDWLAGILPNLACAAVVPLVSFLSPRRFRFRDFALFDLMFLAGLCVYEVMQLWMPRRTFDWDDVRASFVGAAFALVAGASVFAVTRRSGDPPAKAAVK